MLQLNFIDFQCMNVNQTNLMLGIRICFHLCDFLLKILFFYFSIKIYPQEYLILNYNYTRSHQIEHIII